MIVCICSNVSEKDIKRMLPAEPEEVMLATNCAMNCGICFESMIEVIKKFDDSDQEPSYANR